MFTEVYRQKLIRFPIQKYIFTTGSIESQLPPFFLFVQPPLFIQLVFHSVVKLEAQNPTASDIIRLTIHNE